MSENGAERSEERRERKGPPPVDHMFTVKVDNLYVRTDIEKLKEAFAKFGEVGDVYIPRDRYSGENRGFGFVRFMIEADADDAVKEMDGKDVDGNEVRCSMAQNKRPDYERSRGRGGWDDRRRGYNRHNERSDGYNDRRYDYGRGHDDRNRTTGGYRDANRSGRYYSRSRSRSRSKSRDRGRDGGYGGRDGRRRDDRD